MFDVFDLLRRPGEASDARIKAGEIILQDDGRIPLGIDGDEERLRLRVGAERLEDA